MKEKEIVNNRDWKEWISAHHLYSFPAASQRGRTEVRQAIWKPVVLLSCQSQLPLQCTKSSSTSTLLHVFSQKKQRQCSNLAERHQRQVGLRQMPRISTRNTFCFTWESQIYRHPPSSFQLYKLPESKRSCLGLQEKVFHQKDHKCHGKMDAFHLQGTRQRALEQFGSQEQQQSVINDEVIALARSMPRIQISFHLEKQSSFLDTEVFRSREKDVLESLSCLQHTLLSTSGSMGA